MPRRSLLSSPLAGIAGRVLRLFVVATGTPFALALLLLNLAVPAGRVLGLLVIAIVADTAIDPGTMPADFLLPKRQAVDEPQGIAFLDGLATTTARGFPFTDIYRSGP